MPDTKVSDEIDAGTLDGTEEFYCVRSAGTLPRKTTGNRIAALAQALGNGVGFSSIIHNAGMEVSQLNGSTSVPVAFAAGAYTFTRILDRWEHECRGSATVNLQQVADAPLGLTKSLKLTVSVAQAVMGAPDSCNFLQKIEGTYLARAGFGTANALPITFFFFVKANRIGQYGGTFKNAAGNRVWGFSFNVNVANTWEYKSVTVTGDTTGTWLSDTSLAAYFMISQATGSTLGSCTNGAWATTNGSNVPGSVNGIAALTDTFQLTGVASVLGTQAPSAADAIKFIRPITEEIDLCRRYYRRDVQPPLNGAWFNANTLGRIKMPLVPQMRAAPTVTLAGTVTVTDGVTTDTIASIGSNTSTQDVLEINITSTGALMAANRPGYIIQSGTGAISSDAVM